MKKLVYPASLLAITAIVVLAGCSQRTLNSAQQDTQHNINEVKPQLAKLDLGARVTASLKAAGLNGIRVDASANGVSLHGTVKSATDKARAGRIAKDTLGPDKSIDNALTVR